jgi:hypothetical protein
MPTPALALALLASLAVACGTKSDPTPKAADAAPPRPVDAAAVAPAPDAAAPPPAVDAAAAAAGPREDPAVGPAKDLQVLPKDWDRKQVTAFMEKMIEPGLGVKCTHCHDESDWANADDEQFKIGRKMIQLVDYTNRTYFKGEPEVSCFTCHHGKEKP